MTKKTIRFRRITADQFHAHFSLDSPGYFIARDSFAADEIGSSEEAIEVLCLANQLYATILHTKLMQEIHANGRIHDFAEKSGTDAMDFAIEVLGKKRIAILMREVMSEVRAEVKIGENDKKRPAHR
jgi:hypothetical protein